METYSIKWYLDFDPSASAKETVGGAVERDRRGYD